jgi:alpha-N-arabinofuranosidase
MTDLFSHSTSRSSNRATVRLDPSRSADRVVPPELFGTFIEHLYSPWQVKNALEAQVLFNPTVGSWKFQNQTFDADGGRGGIHDREVIADRIEAYTDSHDLPDPDRMYAAYHNGSALWWFPYGDEDAVRTSPDTGTANDRAQRVEVLRSDDRAGIAQWCYLPLHRTHRFEGTVTLRTNEETRVRLALHDVTDRDGSLDEPIAETTVETASEFQSRDFTLDVPHSGSADDALYAFSVTVAGGIDANIVLDRVLLYPDDHSNTADPEIVELLSEADLPVLRWPGGNFVSGYHWEDGVGPIEKRPTKPNPAWDAIESNLFGTDEFIQFCEAVGCEPMICLNAGSGDAAEAARWVEYCNGDPEETEMGAFRAEHGHPEPYDVTYWEIGNELYGPWQITWTTPGGYADRFERFRDAMETVDPSIEVLACGNRLTDWNDPLFDQADDLPWLTDHVLLECHADPGTNPEELFNAHTGIATGLGSEYRRVAADWRESGLSDPRIAITELQLFTRFDEDEEYDGERRMNADDLPRNTSITEAVFDASIVAQCIRDGIVEMITHSGAGNHGAGIQKQREQTWADPSYYGQILGAGLVGGTPIGVDVECGTFATETAFGTDTGEWFGELRPVNGEPSVDAVAVDTPDGHAVAVLLIHQDASVDDIEVTVDGGDLLAGYESVTVHTLTAEEMNHENTYDERNRVTPTETACSVDDDGQITVTLPTYGLVRLTADK